jgi:hypothetical protein
MEAAAVVSIFKKGDRNLVVNYISPSILYNLSKIFKNIMLDYLGARVAQSV